MADQETPDQDAAKSAEIQGVLNFKLGHLIERLVRMADLYVQYGRADAGTPEYEEAWAAYNTLREEVKPVLMHIIGCGIHAGVLCVDVQGAYPDIFAGLDVADVYDNGPVYLVAHADSVHMGGRALPALQWPHDDGCPYGPSEGDDDDLEDEEDEECDS